MKIHPFHSTCISLFFCSALAVTAQVPECEIPGDARRETWTGKQDHYPIDVARALATSPSGDRVFMTAASTLPNNNNNFVTIAYDRDGNFLWKKIYEGPDGIDDTPWAIAVSPDGATVAVAGMQNNNLREIGSTGDWAVVAYEAATGNLRWVTTLDEGGLDSPTAMAFSPDGARVYVTGNSLPFDGPASDYDQVTAAFANSDGARLWRTRVGSPGGGYEQSYALAVSPDGTTVVSTGTYQNAAFIRGFGTVAYDALTGERRWLQSANLGDQTGILSSHVLISPDSSLVHVMGAFTLDTLVVTYRVDNGVEVWRDQRGGVCSFCLPSLAVSPATGDVYLAGDAANPSSSLDFVMVAFRGATGEMLWSTRYDFLGQDESLARLAVSDDGGRVYVTGVSTLRANVRWITSLALAADTGALAWDARYGLPESMDGIGTTPTFNLAAGRRLYVGIEVSSRGAGSDLFLAAYDDDPAPPPPGCGEAWRVVPSPNDVRGIDNILASITAISPNDIWAVGYKTTGINLIEMLILHWDGVEWNIVPNPDLGPGKPIQRLFEVSAVSANDVWAVGDYVSEAESSRLLTLTIHWDGTQWTEVPSLASALRENTLRGLVAVSANDVWAVGSSRAASGQPRRTLILHWKGAQWTQVPSPNAALVGGLEGDNFLLGATAAAPNEIWASGFYLANAGATSLPQTLIMRWNGTTWNIVPSPNMGTASYLTAISAAAPNDIWAVGYYNQVNIPQTLTMRWNGAQWNIVPSPNVGDSFNILGGVSAVSPNEAWAVGFWTDTSDPSFAKSKTLVERWNGTEWSVVDSPNIPGADRNQLVGVAVAPPGLSGQRDVWTVGIYGGNATTLIERYNDPCLEPVQPLSVLSRKRHGDAGNFDVTLPLSGEAGVECRSPGANSGHQVVLRFPNPVTFSGASATPEPGGTASVASTTTSGNEVFINLENVSDAQTLTITLQNVNNHADVSVAMTVLAGDTNADTRVNVGDTNQTKSNSGSLTNEDNFWTDVNLDGRINVGDTNFVKAHAGENLRGGAAPRR